jgi:hypothetical protein
MWEWASETSQSDMQNQKQRYEMPDELLPLWSAVAWHYRDKLEEVDGTGFVATKEEADSVFAELREMTGTEKNLED